MARQKIISSQSSGPEEEQLNITLRPATLDECIGSQELVQKLRIAIQAAKQRGEPMEHVLLHGPPGLGKTTMAHVIANEMGAHIKVTSGPALSRPSDLIGMLTNLQARRRAVHRRDPPPLAGRRGVHLPGHGGVQGGFHGRYRHARRRSTCRSSPSR